jgi:hypothetical protein
MHRKHTHVGIALLAGAVVVPLVAASCGGGTHASSTSTTAHGGSHGSGGADAGPGAGASGGGTGFGGGDSGPLFDGGSGCNTGEACGDGGICTGNVCCSATLACGTTCCNPGSVCSFQSCVTPGATCNDSSDCNVGQYCEYSLGDNGNDAGTPDAACQSGAVLLNGKCLPSPPTCAADAGTPDSGALDCLEQCSFHPVGTFSPALKASWGGVLTAPFNTDVMMAPIVVVLQDTNCDGKVNAKDVPDILFTSFTGGNYQHNGTLHAVRYVGTTALADQWSATGIDPGGQLAGGDIDGLPGNEVIACADGGGTKAFHGDGTPYWTSPAACHIPSIADLVGSGHPQVIVEGGILDGATGALMHSFVPPLDGTFIVSDLDGDGQLDIITADRGYRADGTIFVDTKLGGTWSAIADFLHDGNREVVRIDVSTHTLSLWKYDKTQPNGFTVVRGPVDMNAGFATNHCPTGSAGAAHGGGPPTVADFNGDGFPDVGLAGGIAYVAFDGKKLMDPTVAAAQTILWGVTTTDCSSAETGSSVFDFQGNGIAQAVYSDEEYLRIYDGPTGNVVWKTCNTTGTLIEYPVIADIDNDGHADIVVVSNAYASGNAEYQCNDGTNIAQAGVRVFSDAANTWVRTPPVWNEHAYHVTNVTSDGTIPQSEAANCETLGLDNFRQNKQPGNEFAAPDGIVSVASVCPGPTALVATVRNIGQAAIPAGVDIGFYEGAPPGKLLGRGTTTIALYPAEAQQVTLVLANPDGALLSGASPVYAVFDDGTPAHPAWTECRTDNNTSTPASAACSMAH